MHSVWIVACIRWSRLVDFALLLLVRMFDREYFADNTLLPLTGIEESSQSPGGVGTSKLC